MNAKKARKMIQVGKEMIRKGVEWRDLPMDRSARYISVGRWVSASGQARRWLSPEEFGVEVEKDGRKI